MSRFQRKSVGVALLAAWGSIGSAGALERFDPPAAAEAMAPYLALARDGSAAASWIEPPAGGAGPSRIRFARFSGEAWSAAATVAESSSLFANWADTPGVVEAGNGAWFVWWLEKLGGETYAYGIRLSRSSDGGRSWQALGWLQDDGSQTEHGFVSAVAEGDGVRFFWLDGRATLGGHAAEGGGDSSGHGSGGGKMQLRTTVAGATISPSELVDDSVCDCCSTAAARVGLEALVAYRDRTTAEIRDIRLARLAPVGGRSKGPSSAATPKSPQGAPRSVQGSVEVASDGWKIEGCPVNGPVLVAQEPSVGVAWFTGAQDRARVAVATSNDGGVTFRPPVVIDDKGPLGRVALAPLGAGETALGWLARAGESAELRLVRVAADGTPGAPLVLAKTAAGRKSGVPRLVRLGSGQLFALWTEAGEGPTHLRAARLAPAELPAR